MDPISKKYNQEVQRERQRLGRRIRQAREAMGWTQAELGEQVGLTLAAISAVELGKQSMTIEDMRRWAHVLDKPLAWFFPNELTTNAELDLFLYDVGRMTPDERASVELAIRFVKERRRRGMDEDSDGPRAGGAH